MADQDTMTEVPAALKRLAKYMVRGFYGLEYSLTLDVLIRYPCVKEEDIALLLKFEKKQLRTILQTLKGDKIVKCRMRVQTGPNGKSTKHNYYYINYKVLVDVIKYKLDHVRRKIESDERESTNRASFKCPGCHSTYSDLEVNQLFDPFTELFRCTYCYQEVEEDFSSLPKRDARTLLAKFNEQIEPIFLLLRETEDIVLPSELLEPQPTDIPELADSYEQSAAIGSMDLHGCQGRWADKSSSMGNMYVQNITINVHEGELKKVKEKKGKEQPVWMTKSTVHEVPPELNASFETNEPDIDENANKKDSGGDNEVFRTLLIHEMKSGSGPTPTQTSKSDSDSDTSESDDEKKRTKPAPINPSSSAEQEEEGEAVDPVVMVGGQPHVYSEVSQNPTLVSFMTDEEREAYIKIGQQMFQSAFE
ncbi:PREDICTED: general transcription factor IIE subunit 1-like [Nanorana parkeri]|uniref:general transcription factor IIE subunit 1-like n=1 Tax=Nanorana parkeri TaxID=125878 RepID=UPI0008541763|nr:PREDICTED: general transcription factor IIE subunit 1-like [Nanorana parkeri]